MPQAFKGSLSAHEAARAMARGCRAALPQAEAVALPMADGGDDTLDVLVGATGGQYFEAEVRGPLGAPARARWGALGGGGTAVVEMARASGLRLLDAAHLDPRAASTYGTGELIREALDHGYREILVGMGGSATVDGGAGALSALGVRFLDAAGGLLPPGGAALSALATIDAAGLDRRLAEARVRVACDVDIPMTGPEGPRKFMAQKGCDAEDMDLLSACLDKYCRVVRAATGVDLPATPRSGPAGGLAGGLHAFLGAELVDGGALVLDFIGPPARFDAADLVLTGEGRLDAGTLDGKGVLAVAHAARDAGAPVIAVCGRIDLTPEELRPHGVVASEELGGEDPPDTPSERTAARVEAAAKRAVLRWAGRPPSGAAGV